MTPVPLHATRRTSRTVRTVLAGCAAIALAGAAVVTGAANAAASTVCRADFVVNSQWPGGFTGAVSVVNLGPALTSWAVEFDFPGTQRITQSWNGVYSQEGRRVTIRNEAWNGSLGPDQTVTPGFIGTWSSGDQPPTLFWLNGTQCNVSSTETPSSPTATMGPPDPPVDNPFRGATGYRNPDFAADVAQSAATRSGELAAAMSRVAEQPTAVWLNTIASISEGHGLRWHLDNAVAQQSQLASGQPVVITLVLNNIPNRDCRLWTTHGELEISANGVHRYQAEYIDPIASILADPTYGNLRIAVIIEPGALANLLTGGTSSPYCIEAMNTGAYVESVRYALDNLTTLPNVYTYLDLSHSWALGYDSNRTAAVGLLQTIAAGTAAGPASVDGFAINTAGYTPVEEPYLTDPTATMGGTPMYAASFYEWNRSFDEEDFVPLIRPDLLAAGFPTSIGFLIDTSRNGWGGPDRPTGASPPTTDVNMHVNALRVDRRTIRSNWCNISGAGIGPRPQADPMPWVDAFMWVKPPGESDGSEQPSTPGDFRWCDPNWQQPTGGLRPTDALGGGTPFGTWFDAHFEVLVRNAHPAI